MSDRPADGAEGSWRGRHRRASSPATTGHPDAGHWTKAAPEHSGGAEPRRSSRSEERSGGDDRIETRAPLVAGRDEARPESAEDRWWREQRPPHYE